MMKKKMNTVAVMAMVSMILLSANMDTISVAAQGVNLPTWTPSALLCVNCCYDYCNTGCAGLPSDEYLICDKKCHEMCGDEGKIDGNLVDSARKY